MKINEHSLYLSKVESGETESMDHWTKERGKHIISVPKAPRNSHYHFLFL